MVKKKLQAIKERIPENTLRTIIKKHKITKHERPIKSIKQQIFIYFCKILRIRK
jgi:hypothetical protein